MRIQNKLTFLWSVFASMVVILFSITVPVTAHAETGLDFPGSGSGTVRFKFANPHLKGLPIYGPSGQGVTYIWKYYPRQQAGYYTTFFWGNDDGVGTVGDTFLWKGGPWGAADSYYGFHPYPNPPPSGTAHNWEVSVEQMDYQNGTVEYGKWFTQAARVWADGSGKHHIFYWDIPKTDSSHIVSRTSPTDWGNQNPPSPALTWGDAPWQPGNEVCDDGIIRAIAIYNKALSVNDMLAEANSPLSTAAGNASIWYMNLNPTPNDISDKSGKGHHPVWVGSKRPALYTVGSSENPTPPTNLRIVD